MSKLKITDTSDSDSSPVLCDWEFERQMALAENIMHQDREVLHALAG